MNEIRSIDTEYKGYLFRSRLEARWAVFFDELGVRWEYEPEGILLSDGSYYLPDFYLIDFHCYFEVKRRCIKGTQEGDEAIRKISNGMGSNSWAGIIAFGDPWDDDLTIFCQETDDGGGGPYTARVTIGISRHAKAPVLFSFGDRRERTFYTRFCEDLEVIPMETKWGGYKYSDLVIHSVKMARLKARQARFEHGQTPVHRRGIK